MLRADKRKKEDAALKEQKRVELEGKKKEKEENMSKRRWRRRTIKRYEMKAKGKCKGKRCKCALSTTPRSCHTILARHQFR